MTNVIDTIKDNAIAALDRINDLVNQLQAKANEGADALELFISDLKESISGEKEQLESTARKLSASGNS